MAKRLTVIDTERCVGCQMCMFACARRFNVGGIGKSAIHVKSAGGMERGFVVVVCRACLDPPCAKVCPTQALIPRKGGGVTVKYDKCIGCRLCAEVCIVGAVIWDEEMNKPRICIYCGYCANYCPHGVLEFQEVEGAT